MMINVIYLVFILINVEIIDEVRYCCKVFIKDGYEGR